jgi:hypothetical protein
MRAITSPPGRIVGGSLYEGRATDGDGKKHVYKTGAKAGQEYIQFSFGIAIPKEAGHTHWNQTAWGGEIWAEGQAAAPATHALKSFSWKITDGDSAEANKRGNKPCDQEGYKGSWVVWFQANDFKVPIYNANGTQQLTDDGLVKAGYWIQVRFECDFNKRTDSPGVYLQQKLVAFSAPDTEIILRVQENPADAGFGNAPLPPGVSATPAAVLDAPSAPSAPAPSAPSAPAAPAPGPQPTAKAWTTLEGMLAAENWTLELLIKEGYVTPAPTAAPAPTPTPGTVVTPAPDFLASPSAPSAPAAPSAPVPTGPQPTAKAWTTLEGMLAADGWNLELLIKEGYVTA